MKNILIFGDSNSWGYIPGEGSRYPPELRWPGVASALLGADYFLIEDSISGRTTVYEDPAVPKRCGLDNLGYSLTAHFPLDLVVLFLGTNDLKFSDAEGYRRGITALVEATLNAQTVFRQEHPIFRDKKRVLIVGPPRIHPAIEKLRPSHPLSRAAGESEKLSGIAAEVARAYSVGFVDVSKLVFPDTTDCLHLHPQAHDTLGHVLAAAIADCFCDA